MSIVCIICSDPITATSDVYSTPCGHIFHFLCLCNWMERSKTCPQCRQKTSNKHNHRVFLNFANNGDNKAETIQTMQFKMDSLNCQVNEAKMQVNRLRDDNGTLKQQNAGLRLEVADLERKERAAHSAILAFKDQIKFYKSKLGDYDRLHDEVTELRLKLKDFDNLEAVVQGTRVQVDEIIRNENNIESLALITATLKKSLVESQRNKRDAEHRLKKCQNEMASVKYQLEAARTANAELQRQVEELTAQFQHAKDSWAGEKANIKAKVDRMIQEGASEEKKVYVASDAIEATPELKRKRKLIEIELNVSASTPVEEKVEKIRSATSPYLPIKSSSIGIQFLERKGGPSGSFSSFSQSRRSKFVNPAPSSSSISLKRTLSSGSLTVDSSKRSKSSASTVSAAKFKKLAPPKLKPSQDDDFIVFD